MEGDNRNNSLDSIRKLGYFDFEEDVMEKVFLRFLSFRKSR